MKLECTEKFKKLGTAFRILSDDDLRSEYDAKMAAQRFREQVDRRRGSYYPQPGDHPTSDDSDFGLADNDPYNAFKEAFGAGFKARGVHVVFRNGRFHFIPKGEFDPNKKDYESSVSRHKQYSDSHSDGSEGTVTSQQRHEEKLNDLCAAFPKIDSDLVRDVLYNVKFNMQKAAETLLEIQEAQPGGTSEVSTAVEQSQRSEDVWEKLKHLQTLFPGFEEDVLYEVLIWNRN
eukprot:CAMPEP_0197520710 /NCGR_PEP_ID=MMETSP1318-20131121/6046_1 /TAXON_ID=552666 /ORGANISM="Partenskyella glossopodia, Strain RCC365" /LENGTH=231 /DNA_ID=CAMNT_0043072407 /DNA_START=213 /DNA_END=905 /DNA_ORIENTATION=+